MPVRIDHVIALAPDLARLEAAFARLGFVVTGGGTHPQLGTRNRLILLGESYLELLAVEDAGRVSPAVTRRLAAPGWVGMALQSEAIDAEVAAARARGSVIYGPRPGRLEAPDGTARGWRVATAGSDDLWEAAEPVPFLIQHDSTGEQHRRELAGAGSLAPHPNGAFGVVEVVTATDDLDGLLSRYEAVYGVRAVAVREGSHAAPGVAFALDDGRQQVVLANAADGEAAQHRLGVAGPGVCLVTLGVRDLAATAAYLRRAQVPCDEDGATLRVAREATGGAALAFVAR